jgi:hypothetical protein
MRKSWVALHSHPETRSACDSRIGKQHKRHAGASERAQSNQKPALPATRTEHPQPYPLSLYLFK